MHQWMSRFAVLVAVLSFAGAWWLSYQHVVHKDEINATAKNDLMVITSAAVSQIDLLLMKVVRSAEVLASELSKGRLPEEEMHALLRDVLASNVHYFGGTITFRPYGYDESRKLYSAYYTRSKNNALIYQRLDEVYDYTSSEYDWYVLPMKEGSRWGEPYWDKAAKTSMVTYSAVFYQLESDLPLGVVTFDISMNQVQTIIESLDLGPSGFGALTTRDGGYLYHPNQAYVQNKKNIRDVAKEKGDANRLIIAKDILQGKSGVIDHISTTTGQASWLIYESIAVSGWSLQNTFIKDDLPIDVDILRKEQIRIILLVVIFLIASAFLLFRAHHGEHFRVWLFTVICSFILMVGIGSIWHLALTYYSSSNVPGVKISDKETLKAVVNGYTIRSQERQLETPYYVPTGIYIDTIEFQSANNLLIAGRVWQAYGAGYPDEMAQKTLKKQS